MPSMESDERMFSGTLVVGHTGNEGNSMEIEEFSNWTKLAESRKVNKPKFNSQFSENRKAQHNLPKIVSNLSENH